MWTVGRQGVRDKIVSATSETTNKSKSGSDKTRENYSVATNALPGWLCRITGLKLGFDRRPLIMVAWNSALDFKLNSCLFKFWNSATISSITNEDGWASPLHMKQNALRNSCAYSNVKCNKINVFILRWLDSCLTWTSVVSATHSRRGDHWRNEGFPVAFSISAAPSTVFQAQSLCLALAISSPPTHVFALVIFLQTLHCASQQAGAEDATL